MAARSARISKMAVEPPPDMVLDYVLEDHVGFLLRRAHQRHAAIFAEHIGSPDLTPTQFAALIRTVQLGRVSQNHLGRLTAMDPATIQGVVRRLCERGCLRREDDPLDRRSIVLIPTETGRAIAGNAVNAVRAIAETALAPLAAAEAAELKRLLAKIG